MELLCKSLMYSHITFERSETIVVWRFSVSCFFSLWEFFFKAMYWFWCYVHLRFPVDSFFRFVNHSGIFLLHSLLHSHNLLKNLAFRTRLIFMFLSFPCFFLYLSIEFTFVILETPFCCCCFLYCLNLFMCIYVVSRPWQ